MPGKPCRSTYHRPNSQSTSTSQRPQPYSEERESSPTPEQLSQPRRATNNRARGHNLNRRGHRPDTTSNHPWPPHNLLPSQVSRRRPVSQGRNHIKPLNFLTSPSGEPHTLQREYQQPPTKADAVHTPVTLYTHQHHECVLHCSRRG
jgi:hypothetical protein